MDADLEAISRRREEVHAELLARSSAVYRAFLELERAAFADGELSKLRQLVAVGLLAVFGEELR